MAQYTCLFQFLQTVREQALLRKEQPVPADNPTARQIGYMVGGEVHRIGIVAVKNSLDVGPPPGWTAEEVDEIRRAVSTPEGRVALVRQPG